MASAGTVSVEFKAETGAFLSDLRRVQTGVKGVGQDLDLLGELGSKAFKFLTAGALLQFARQSFTAADAIGDAAERAGVAVESFSRLKFAAEQSDVELASLTVGLKKFQTELSKAAEGGNAAAGAFAQIGLSGQQLKDLSLEQQLGAVADAFQRIQNPADRVRVAVELFGKSGSDLIPLLSQGAAGINKLTAEADRLGITLNTSTAIGIGEADKALKRLIATAQAQGANVLGRIALILNPPKDEAGRLAVQIATLEERLPVLRDLVSRNPNSGFFANQLKEVEAELDRLRPKLNDVQKTVFTYGNVTFPWLDQLQEIDLKKIEALKIPENPYGDLNLANSADTAIFRAQSQELFRSTTIQLAEELASSQKDIEAGVTSDLIQQLQIRSQAVTEFQNRTLQAENAMIAARERAMTSGIQALQAFAGQSKKVAIALVLINKARAISTAIQNTLAGATLQLTSGDPYTAVARAAAVKAWGAIQVAGIVASGFGEIQAINSSGGAPLGSPVNPVTTTPASDASQPGASSQRAVQVVFAGPVFTNDQTKRFIADAIREAVDDQDVIIIGSGSRQAQELLGG